MKSETQIKQMNLECKIALAIGRSQDTGKQTRVVCESWKEAEVALNSLLGNSFEWVPGCGKNRYSPTGSMIHFEASICPVGHTQWSIRVICSSY